MKKISLTTESGCRKILAILLVIILVCSFFAYMIQCSWGKVKISDVKFDTRGAVQDADLYVPVGTNDKDSLPCIILSHGGGCTNGVMTGMAQELARRGFVVLNVSSYGAGLSEQPMYDEDGHGIEGMGVKSQGLWDAVNYVRTLKYVDQTKIAVGGHSQGAYRSAYVAVNDCGYLTVNDMLINYLCDEFGMNFTAEEINEDARTLAAAKLNDDQMKLFDLKAEEVQQWMDTRIKAIIPVGSATMAVSNGMRPQIVTVGGHEVSRFVQTNVGMVCGEHDHNWPFIEGKQSIFEGESFPTTYFQTNGEVVQDTWLELTDSGIANDLGSIYDTSIASSEALADAVASRSTRVLLGIPNVTHSQEFHSNATTAAVIKYVEQVFEYNNGDINGENNAIDSENIVWLVREYLNTVAMIAMIGCAVVLLALLVKKEFFTGVSKEFQPDELKLPASKGFKAAFWALSVLAATVACYIGNTNKAQFQVMKSGKFFPLDGTAVAAFGYLFYLGVFLFALLAVFAFLHKKTEGNYGLAKLGINIGAKNILKALLLSFIVLLFCYGTLAFIEYWFFQDYRWWMCVFTMMQRIHWGQFFRYAICFVPFHFAICAAINYTTDSASLSSKSDIILTIVLGSLGVYINHFINVAGMYANPDTLTILSQATLIGGLLMFVPLTVYVSRKSYKITSSIWTGVFINTFLNAWLVVSAISSTNQYMGTTFLEKFLGF